MRKPTYTHCPNAGCGHRTTPNSLKIHRQRCDPASVTERTYFRTHRATWPERAAIITTPEDRHILAYALGLERGKGCRNFYCAENGAPRLEALVGRGLMRYGAVLDAGRYRYYHVTEAGARAIGAKLP